MEKIYEKTCGKAYKKMVDEQDGPGFKKANGMGADWVPKTVGQSSEKYRENVMEEEDLEEDTLYNGKDNQGSNDNSNSYKDSFGSKGRFNN